MKLSKSYTLDELISSGMCYAYSTDLTPDSPLKRLITNVLQPAQQLWKEPLTFFLELKSDYWIDSDPVDENNKYVALNAVYIQSSNNTALFRLIEKKLPFYQLVWVDGNPQQPEYVYVSYNHVNNRQLMRMIRVGNQKVYTPIRKEHKHSTVSQKKTNLEI